MPVIEKMFRFKSAGSFSRTTGIVLLMSVALVFFACCSRKESKGVIIIVLDALRKDHLSCFGYTRPTSPFIDALAAKNVLFKNVISAAPQTVPSVSSILTGLYPYRHGSHFFSRSQSYHPFRPVANGGLPLMNDKNLLLAEVFQEAGYRTALISSNPGIRNIYGFSQGVEYFRFINCFSEEGAGVCDGSSVNRIFAGNVLPLIKDQNFFVYLHYMDIHNPYRKPNSFKGRFMKYSGEPVYVNGKPHSVSSEQLEYSQACYDEGIIYLDEVLKQLFSLLEKEGLLNKTLIVITADHGDEFMEHGGLGHGTTCYNELTNSFLLIVNPSLKHRTIESAVSDTDIFPTVLEWADLTVPEDLDGYSLSGFIKDGYSGGKMPENRVFVSELGDRKALTDGRWKFIYNLDTKKQELYDLSEDPSETRNIAENRRNLAEHYLDIVKKIVKKMALSYSEKSLSKTELRNLESLGYIH